jgi:hypothetical protein
MKQNVYARGVKDDSAVRKQKPFRMAPERFRMLMLHMAAETRGGGAVQRPSLIEQVLVIVYNKVNILASGMFENLTVRESAP